MKCFEDEISRLGYEFVDIVQDKGEISIRADIIDIFCINEENPIRILLFGEEIESIRYLICKVKSLFLTNWNILKFVLF